MSNNPERVLVIGATGYIGRFVIANLKSQGYRVRAVVRDQHRAQEPGNYHAPALKGLVDEWVVRPSNDQPLDPKTMDSVDRVVSTLGVTRQKADPWDIDFRLNLRYLDLAEQAKVKSFLYVGVVKAASGTSAVARSKHAFIEILRRSPVTSQIINPSGYFSDLSEIFAMAQHGLAVGLGDGTTRLSPIHGADLADFCVQKLSEDRGVWDVGGPDVLTYRQIVDLAFSTLGKNERYLRLPESISTPATWVADRISPRAGSLTRFFLEGLQTDATAQPFGSRKLDDYFEQLAHEQTHGAS
ncbi:NmrA family NAD(P)-binding protein [Glutamicibacter sp.]|uniref:SDR family oxidoreductase n=1 Tax=Glutamicibacter sp. TaxID=1931995 RepID=UPI0028BDE5B6|nr:NmrA family NAD(P)-binding protein [Glutamicibacter sp.]